MNSAPPYNISCRRFRLQREILLVDETSCAVFCAAGEAGSASGSRRFAKRCAHSRQRYGWIPPTLARCSHKPVLRER
jgi:hypothetical protein